MKRVLLCAAASTALTAGAVQADEGWYGKAMVGYGWTSDLDVNVEDQITSAIEEFDIEAEGDLRFLLGGGYAFSNGWRADADFVWRSNDLGAVDDTQGSSEIEGYSLMANAAYDFNRDGGLRPYLGGGLGLGYADVSVTDQGVSGSADEYRTAGQVFAGLGFGVTERIRAAVEYRYYRMFDDVDVMVGDEEFRFRDPDSQDIFLGFTVNFGASAAAASSGVAEGPTLAGAVLDPVCDDLPFVVYFGWDATNLSDQAKQVIAQAAAQAQECEITKVTVVGHADTTGSERYNIGLSERRAAMVRDELVLQGVDAGLILVNGAGESEPAVATGDNVREPLNRRANAMILVVNDDAADDAEDEATN